MKKLVYLMIGLLVCAGSLSAQTTTSLSASTLDQVIAQAQQRQSNYNSGAALATATQLYNANYWDNSYWKNFWTQSHATSDTWYQQYMIIQVVIQNYIQHMQASTNWIPNVTALTGADGQVISLNRVQVYDGMRTYYWQYNAVVDGQTYSDTDLNALVTRVKEVWYEDSSTDPTKAFMPHYFKYGDQNGQDLNILSESSFNGATNLYQMLVTNGQVASLVGSLDTSINPNLTIPASSLSDPSYLDALNNLGIKPVNQFVGQKDASSIVAILQKLYANQQTDPQVLEAAACSALFDDLFVGGWGSAPGPNSSGWWNNASSTWSSSYNGNQWVFNHTNGPVAHSTTYYKALATYDANAALVIGYLQVLLGQMTTQVAQANADDTTMLGMVSTYRQQQTNQSPIQSAITDSAAQQLFNSSVGNQSLSSIPLIGMAQYLIYEILPPWASSVTIPGTYDPPIDNPFYETILAQLIRGCETSSGEVMPSANQSIAALKSSTQQSMAIQDIEDKVNKQVTQSDLQQRSDLIQKEMDTSFGNNSYKLSFDMPVTPTSQVQFSVTASGDALTSATLANAQTARNQSASLAAQQASYYNSMTGGSNTINDYARLNNAQQVTKAQSVQALGTVLNNKSELHAVDRQQKAQAAAQQQLIDNAAVNIPNN